MFDPFDSRVTLTVLSLRNMDMPTLDCDWCPLTEPGTATMHVTSHYDFLAEPSVSFACGKHYAEHFAGHKGEPQRVHADGLIR